MQGDSGLAAAGDSLDDEGLIFRRTDNAVLFGLNGGDNVPQLIVFVFFQPIEQEFIRHSQVVAVANVTVDHPLQDLFADDKISLQIDKPSMIPSGDS